MSSGLKWNEKVPYSHPENSEIRMDRSPDKIEYILSQPMDHTPGTVWNYNGGNTQLLAAIIEKTTGKRIDQFANEFLFQPLGIEKFEWAKYRRTDIPAAASGLRLRPRDMLKFGLLYNDNGKWGDKTILSPKWIESSFQSHMRYSETGGYGYQFWTWQDTIENKIIPFVYCDGNGDQKIIFDKTHDLLIISTAGNYNKWDIPNHVYALLKRFVFPAIKE
jgi:CubicO group peptidase (beta-lactamase class C family)